MILVDAGNSYLKARYIKKDHLYSSYSTAYTPAWEQRFSNWLNSCDASACYQASVLDRNRQALLDQSLSTHFADGVNRIYSQSHCLDVTSAYHQPERLGVDRWLALIGAAGSGSGDCVVVDAGSAITVDLLLADGHHLGGAILRGMNTSTDRFREIFSHIDFDHADVAQTEAPGCSTEQAIHINYTQDSSEYLSQLLDRWQGRFENGFTLLLTGGDAPKLQQRLQPGSRILPDLVFQGIYRLAKA